MHRRDSSRTCTWVSGGRGEGLGVEVLDHGEAAELPLHAVPVAVVVAVLRGQPAAGDRVSHFDPGDHVHGERQGGAPPGRRVGLVTQVFLRGRRIRHPGVGAEMVVQHFEQVRLDPAGEVQEPQVRLARAVGSAAEQQPGHPGAVQVGQLQGVGVGYARGAGDGDRLFGPGVAGLVAPQQHPPVVDVDQVGGAVPVEVAEQHPARVVPVGQPRRPAHRDLRTPAAVPEVRPVGDVPVAQQDDVVQAVAGHVRQPYPRVGQVHSRAGAVADGGALPGQSRGRGR